MSMLYKFICKYGAEWHPQFWVSRTKSNITPWKWQQQHPSQDCHWWPFRSWHLIAGPPFPIWTNHRNFVIVKSCPYNFISANIHVLQSRPCRWACSTLYISQLQCLSGTSSGKHFLPDSRLSEHLHVAASRTKASLIKATPLCFSSASSQTAWFSICGLAFVYSTEVWYTISGFKGFKNSMISVSRVRTALSIFRLICAAGNVAAISPSLFSLCEDFVVILSCFVLGPHLAPLEVTPGSAFSNNSWQTRETFWDAEDKTWFGSEQDKHLTHVLLFLPPPAQSFFYIIASTKLRWILN